MFASLLLFTAISCVGDANHDHVVDVNDILVVTNSWGTCGSPCDADRTSDNVVDVNDMLVVLADWGCTDTMTIPQAIRFDQSGRSTEANVPCNANQFHRNENRVLPLRTTTVFPAYETTMLPMDNTAGYGASDPAWSSRLAPVSTGTAATSGAQDFYNSTTGDWEVAYQHEGGSGDAILTVTDVSGNVLMDICPASDGKLGVYDRASATTLRGALTHALSVGERVFVRVDVNQGTNGTDGVVILSIIDPLTGLAIDAVTVSSIDLGDVSGGSTIGEMYSGAVRLRGGAAVLKGNFGQTRAATKNGFIPFPWTTQCITVGPLIGSTNNWTAVGAGTLADCLQTYDDKTGVTGKSIRREASQGITSFSSQPDSTTGIDGLLEKTTPDINTPDGASMRVGSNVLTMGRAFVVFDISSVGTDHAIAGALLTLNCTTAATAATPGTIFMIAGNASNIVENQITWNTRSTSPGAWTAPGGDAESGVSALSITLPAATGAVSYDVNAFVRRAALKGYTKIGFIIMRNDETTNDNNRAVFATCEAATAGNRPQLTFTATLSKLTFPLNSITGTQLDSTTDIYAVNVTMDGWCDTTSSANRFILGWVYDGVEYDWGVLGTAQMNPPVAGDGGFPHTRSLMFNAVSSTQYLGPDGLPWTKAKIAASTITVRMPVATDGCNITMLAVNVMEAYTGAIEYPASPSGASVPKRSRQRRRGKGKPRFRGSLAVR